MALAQGKGDAAVDEGLYSCGKARGQVAVNFKPDVELKDLITWAMGFTCKNFVYSSSIGSRSAKVTIIAPKKMSARQAWDVFLVALSTMNLTVVPEGNVLRLVEAPQAKTEALPVYRKGTPAANSQLVRMVMRPSHVPVEDVATALNALKSKDGIVTSLPSAGVLVITDYGSIINKMVSLVREVDQPVSGERLYLIKVRHADVTELGAKLQEIIGTQAGSGAGGPPIVQSKGGSRRGDSKAAPQASKVSAAEVDAAVPSKIVVEERTSSLILLAGEPAYLRVLALVKRLDVPIEIEGTGRIHVYPLDNADAEEMSTTLTAVISGISQPQGGTSSSRRSTRSTRSAPSQSSSSTSGSGAGSSPAFEGQVRVTHDKPTNALVIIASAKDFLALRDVIRKLDLPRRQVFIEATILEVKTNNSRNLGASFHGGAPVGDDGALALGGLQYDSLKSILPATLASSTGLLGGIIGPELEGASELLGTSIPSFGLLFQALATSSDVNVLSSPHLVTSDNEEAEISVGENIPYQSTLGSLSSGAGGFGFPVPPSVQRQDVALKLKITPQINASDMVRLEIDQEISDIASRNFEGLGPSWAKRTIKTTVVVRDQQTIVIGGLMADRYTYDETKIPLLGDVPLLGYLFKYTTKTKAKTNLLVLLTPYVIKDQLDVEQIVQRKVRERNEFVRSFAHFSSMEYRPQTDYRRKRGLLEEINRALMSVERDAELLREADIMQVELPEGVIEYDPSTVDENPADDDAPADGADGADVTSETSPASPSGSGQSE